VVFLAEIPFEKTPKIDIIESGDEKQIIQTRLKNRKGSSLVELVIVTVLFAILVPASLGVFVSGSKISGQAYIQHQAAVTLGEVDDILRYMRNMDISLLPNGNFI